MPYDIQRLPTGPGGLFYGVYPALVTDLQDPDGQGRVKIRLPWTPDTGSGRYEQWARLAVLMAGAGRGTWFIPDVDDEVLVAFEGGNPARPYVVGALLNGKDQPPEQMDAYNTKKVILSRSSGTIRTSPLARSLLCNKYLRRSSCGTVVTRSCG